ncbi:MAG TPA: valine--tRNA ligase, partial [Candidatus Baltobacteraceae bacterium]|nr:valine--tRNA ligase [Candidatus Baltobacteraceae bacterium]
MPHPSELSKSYDPASVEPRRYAEWLASGVFHEEPDPARPPFVISMPPPNITGRLHLGHASTYTPQDALTRYHRMLGENADWIPGQDHAAIATEAVLVRELAKEGTTREALGREAYLERAWAWRDEYGHAIDDQFRLMGFGPDWARERFTLDPGLSAAVVKVFVQLYRQGLIYRGKRLINWDPGSQSTLSDAEIENEERDGFLWYVRYPAEDGSFAIEVATTRPETMLGDTAVAVHPHDERYAGLVGKRVLLPLTGRTIPIIADAAVERDFGTGAVKVTPAHDPLDNEIGERHALAMPSVIGFDAKITAEAPAPYVGLDRFAAREAVVRDLAAQGLLVRSEPRRHTVPISSRGGAVVEPLLMLQWFCKMESLAKPALEAYRDGRIRFVPERFGRTYEQWLSNIRDWNISRQIWWGHRLPVWYTPADDPIVAETEEEAYRIAREQFGTSDLRRDPDTLDTWFSSALWPFSILGWPTPTPELAAWYPNQVMITSREI